MTPAELSAALVTALDAAVAAGDLHGAGRRDGRRTVTVERPRSAEHGDYATNIALQLAKTVGRPPREVARCWPRTSRRCPGIASVDVAGPGFLNITLDAAAQGELARTDRAGGRRVRANTSMSGAAHQPRVRLGQPDRPDPHGRHALGGGRATRWPACSTASGAEVEREYYFNDHGAQIDRFARSLLARARWARRSPEDGYAGQYIDDLAARIVARAPRRPDLARRRGAGELPRARRRPDVRRDQAEPVTTSGSSSTSYFHENSLHESGAVAARGRPAARARAHLRAGRRGLAAHHRRSATTRTGSSSRATATPPTSPATSPTTSTSASVGSTRSSSCSAPTITGTSAG